jgi:hypothetical protein
LTLTDFLLTVRMPMRLSGNAKMKRLISIVSGGEQITERRNSPLKSRAQISDGSGETVLRRVQKNFTPLN